jgi:hypothetical protein
VWLAPGGASTAAKKKKVTYSAQDCQIIQNIKVDPSKGSGSFGTAAKATAKAYNEAAADVENKQLRSSMKKLASFYVDLGGVNNAAEAAILTAKGAKAYGKALGVFVKAQVFCISQITIPSITIPSLTTPTTSSSATTTSTSSASTTTSTSSPTTTTTTR